LRRADEVLGDAPGGGDELAAAPCFGLDRFAMVI